MSKGMQKYHTDGGKEVFGTMMKAFGLEHFSITSTNMDDDEFRQVQGFCPVVRRGHINEFDSETAELQSGI